MPGINTQDRIAELETIAELRAEVARLAAELHQLQCIAAEEERIEALYERTPDETMDELELRIWH